MDLKGKNEYFIANNADELLSALKNKEHYIIVRGDYKKEFEETVELPLTETELMGFELGFRGTAQIWGELFYQIFNVFSKKNKQQIKIESKLRKYIIKKQNDHEILLYLRQLDY